VDTCREKCVFFPDTDVSKEKKEPNSSLGWGCRVSHLAIAIRMIQSDFTDEFW